jgi:hypothetical protein
MADNNRKPISTQVSEKMTPDSHKTMGEQIKESITGTFDRVKAAVTPNSEKSLSQQAADKARGSHDRMKQPNPMNRSHDL